jgi:hypothetical protein
VKTFIRARDVRLLIKLELDRRRLVKSIEVHRASLGLSEQQLEDAVRDLDSFLRFRRDFPDDPTLAHDAQARHERVLAARKLLVGKKMGMTDEEKQKRAEQRAKVLEKVKAERDAKKAKHAALALNGKKPTKQERDLAELLKDISPEDLALVEEIRQQSRK